MKLLAPVIVFLLIFVSSQASAVFDPETPIPTNQSQNKNYIVSFGKNVKDTDKDKVLNKFRAKRQKKLDIINADVVSASEQDIQKLKKDPKVSFVEEDTPVYPACHYFFHMCIRITLTPTTTPNITPTPTPTNTPTPTPTNSPTPTPTGSQTPTPTNSPTPSPTPVTSTQQIPWGVDRIDAEKVWSKTRANTVRVAVLDSGADMDHEDLQGNIKGSYNTFGGSNTEDGLGHGTHVAGTIGALNNNVGVIGVAPRVNLYIVKVLSDSGTGSLSNLISGIQWARNNNMDVVNMSILSNSGSTSLRNAVIAAKSSGIVLVASAGNSGPSENTVKYPAKYPEVIAVAATTSTDTAPSWSSRGPEIDVTAPGNAVRSTKRNNRYGNLSGTSMASPHVAGVAALIIATHPDFSPSQVESRLESTADKLPGLTTTQQGAGLIDADQAVLNP